MQKPTINLNYTVKYNRSSKVWSIHSGNDYYSVWKSEKKLYCISDGKYARTLRDAIIHALQKMNVL